MKNGMRLGRAAAPVRSGLPRLHVAPVALNGAGGRLRSITFKANGTWKAPNGLRKVKRISGQGGMSYTLRTYRTTTYFFTNNAGSATTDPPELVSTDSVSAGTVTPGDYCDAPQAASGTYFGNEYDSLQHCYSFSKSSTSSSASALGQSFPAAGVKTVQNVEVIAGTTYNITVPSGGFVTIWY